MKKFLSLLLTGAALLTQTLAVKANGNYSVRCPGESIRLTLKDGSTWTRVPAYFYLTNRRNENQSHYLFATDSLSCHITKSWYSYAFNGPNGASERELTLGSQLPPGFYFLRFEGQIRRADGTYGLEQVTLDIMVPFD
ncbi:MAG: hypothetical protein LBJ95_01280 [Oscillospiraceae bacterium]|jgi:hypothetical protein|nr:hypothetical protein [Oscillospiraceae bacterium]